MSPLPWPLIRRTTSRRRKRLVKVSALPKPDHTGGNAEDCPACDVRTMPYPWVCPGEPDAPAPTVRPEPADDETDHAEMYRNHAWVRREDDVVLPRLAQLTEQHGPWDAAMRLFADTPKETR